MAKAQTICWFDLPVADLDRAIGFYTQVLAAKIEKMDFGMPLGIFDHTDDTVGGCLTQEENFRPFDHGLLLYFNVNGRLDDALTHVTAQGGKILEPKHAIGSYGYRAVVLDSEGNRIALHSVTE